MLSSAVGGVTRTLGGAVGRVLRDAGGAGGRSVHSDEEGPLAGVAGEHLGEPLVGGDGDEVTVGVVVQERDALWRGTRGAGVDPEERDQVRPEGGVGRGFAEREAQLDAAV